MKLIVHIDTTNPAALDQLRQHLEANPLDTDTDGRLHPLTVGITDEHGDLLWGSVWDPEEAGFGHECGACA